jgi:ferredoxin--NADP+ reductase
MLDELVQELKRRGFVEGSSHEPGDYAIERAFVEK